MAPTSQTGHSKSCDHNVIVYPGDYHNATEYGSNPCQTDDNSVFANQCVLSASCTSLLSPLLLPARRVQSDGYDSLWCPIAVKAVPQSAPPPSGMHARTHG